MALVDWWEFELVDGYGNKVGVLDGVESGSVSGNVNAQIRWAGRLTVGGRPAVDWGRFRVRPVRYVRADNGTQTGQAFGTYLVRETKRVTRPEAERLELDLYDRTVVVAEDASAQSYTIAAGTPVTDAVSQLIASTGETGVSITPTSDVTGANLVWEPGETKLRIINDLAEHAGYFSLWADHDGQYRYEPYQPPQFRPVAYWAVPGEEARHTPDFDTDLHGVVHNRVVCVSQETGGQAAMIAEARNENPASPWSYQAQGRWVTRVVENVEAATQTVLNQHAQRLLAGEGMSGLKTVRRMLPRPLELNSIIGAREADGREVRETVENVEISFTSATLMRVTSRTVT